jgi:hypothetical protein
MDAPEAREIGYHLGWWGLLTPLIYMVDDMVNIWLLYCYYMVKDG